LICVLVNIQRTEKKQKKARRSIKTLAERLMRELQHLLPDQLELRDVLALYEQAINNATQKTKSILCMKQRYAVFQKEKNTNCMSLETKHHS
jgi:succinate dehydrogenase/fumarate reductase flavoprotein subunit